MIFILGSQRSGTSLMRRTLERDWNTKVYGEFSKLSSNDRQRGSRLNPLDSVADALDVERAPLVVLKPIVESQNSSSLLEYFAESKALWMYRNHKDVALSHVKYFGRESAINSLRAVTENRTQDWRSENVPGSLRQVVVELFSEDMDPFDAAALFWFLRNSLFFAQGLEKDSRVMLVKYENFAANPNSCLRRVYEFVGRPYPGRKIVREVHARSVGKGSDVRLSPDIDVLCWKLLERFEQVYQAGLSSDKHAKVES